MVVISSVQAWYTGWSHHLVRPVVQRHSFVVSLSSCGVKCVFGLLTVLFYTALDLPITTKLIKFSVSHHHQCQDSWGGGGGGDGGAICHCCCSEQTPHDHKIYPWRRNAFTSFSCYAWLKCILTENVQLWLADHGVQLISHDYMWILHKDTIIHKYLCGYSVSGVYSGRMCSLSILHRGRMTYWLKGLIYSDEASGEARGLVLVMKSTPSLLPDKHHTHGVTAALETLNLVIWRTLTTKVWDILLFSASLCGCV